MFPWDRSKPVFFSPTASTELTGHRMLSCGRVPPMLPSLACSIATRATLRRALIIRTGRNEEGLKCSVEQGGRLSIEQAVECHHAIEQRAKVKIATIEPFRGCLR